MGKTMESKTKKIRYCDLFAGIGGFHYGLSRINKSKNETIQITKDKHLSNGNNIQRTTFACVYSNEYDKYANSVYKYHFGECDSRDIREVKAEEIPDHDLLCGGFPCQSFSIAGKRRGFEDTRGTLFFEIARILKQKQPRLLLLENVKGLLSHDKGKTFTTIISTLDELGYDIQWQVLNSKNFGVPQNRERVFIIGNLRGTPRPKVFPIGEISPQSFNQTNIVSRKISTNEKGGSQDSPNFNSQILEDGKNRHLHTGKVMIPEATKTGYAVATEGDSINLSVPESKTRRGRVGKGVAQTLDTGMQQYTLQDMRIRRLTPIECERLQGFPDNWTKTGINGEISDTQRYKMAGNAVTTNVITAIGKLLLDMNN